MVIAASGVLHHPRMPEIDGLDEFEGAMFHSARWDHDVPIDGRRVGVIGTGSTAVQITGALVDRVEHFSLFQRTPQWIMPMDNKLFSDDQRATFRNEPHRLRELRDFLESAFAENFADAVVDAKSERLEQIEETCRANLYQHVTDTELRRRLEPDYRAACKRLVVSADFYDAIQKPNAELVTAAISRIERRGIRTDTGRLHELDVIVLATGFEVDRFMRPTVITGLDGRTLEEAWADGPTAYLSVSIPEFPNLFMLNGPNGPVGNFSLIQVAELQMDYILQLVRRLQAGLSTEIHATEAAMPRARGPAHRSGAGDRVGDRMQQLVPRRSRRTSSVAVAVPPIPRGHGRTRPGCVPPLSRETRESDDSPRLLVYIPTSVSAGGISQSWGQGVSEAIMSSLTARLQDLAGCSPRQVRFEHDVLGRFELREPWLAVGEKVFSGRAARVV